MDIALLCNPSDSQVFQNPDNTRKGSFSKSDLAVWYAQHVAMLKEKWVGQYGASNRPEEKEDWQDDWYKLYPMLLRSQERKKKECNSCGTTETPEWRTGPAFTRLCNACGLKDRRKRKKQQQELEESTKRSKHASETE